MRHNKKKRIPWKIFLILIIICIVFISIVIIRKINKEKYGYIDNGKVVYPKSVSNKSYNVENELAVVEIKTKRDELNSVIITNEMLNRIKEGHEEYSESIEDVINTKDLSSREKYNIQKAVELGIITENDSLEQYYIVVTGFKNKKDFVKFCDRCFELIEKEYKGV